MTVFLVYSARGATFFHAAAEAASLFSLDGDLLEVKSGGPPGPFLCSWARSKDKQFSGQWYFLHQWRTEFGRFVLSSSHPTSGSTWLRFSFLCRLRVLLSVAAVRSGPEGHPRFSMDGCDMTGAFFPPSPPPLASVLHPKSMADALLSFEMSADNSVFFPLEVYAP